MGKNRKISKKMSVVQSGIMRFGVVAFAAFIMVIVNVLASSHCTHLMKSIGERERELHKLDDALSRESSRWNEMKMPENLEIALLRHGLKMRMPRPNQNIRMNVNGVPRPGQLSLSHARQTPAGGVKPASYRRKSR